MATVDRVEVLGGSRGLQVVPGKPLGKLPRQDLGGRDLVGWEPFVWELVGQGPLEQ